jgi:4-hydroxybenzoate polyprenyltransferase
MKLSLEVITPPLSDLLGLKKFTQSIPFFKNVHTVLTWALAGTFSAAFFCSLEITIIYLPLFLFIFLKMLPVAFFFDLKDRENDQKEGLKTIPVLLGKKKTLKLINRLNIISFIPLLLGIYFKIIPFFAVVLILFFIYSKYYLNIAEKSRNKELRMVTYTLPDAEFMLWPILLIIGKFLWF